MDEIREAIRQLDSDRPGIMVVDSRKILDLLLRMLDRIETLEGRVRDLERQRSDPYER